MIDRLCALIKMQIPKRNRGLLFASGISKPSDDTDGFQASCIFQDTTNGIVYVNEGSVTACAFAVVEAGTFVNGIVFPGTVTDRILDYTDTTAIDEPSTGHLIRYGASGSPIPWTPTETCNGIQMYITSTGPADGGFALAGVRVKVTLTGTTKITVNAGNFWTKIDCTDYTGHYLGGHPSGLQGVIELAGTARNATSQYAVMAGVVGEVRPITTSGSVDLGGVICGLHAKVFALASEVNTGDVVGLFVQTVAAGAADIGILVQPYVSATWTTGLEFDSSYGAIANGIVFTGAITTRVIDYANTTAIDEPGVGHLLRYGQDDAPIPWTPTATCSGLNMSITSTGPTNGGFGLNGIRCKVTLTGTTKITANAGVFWTKIDCVDYTGDEYGGHPTGVSGVIELAGALRQAATADAVMAGVVGEVRPITTAGTVDVGGVICGFHAKIFAVSTDVDTGDVVGLFVEHVGGSAGDIGILVKPHYGGAAWTVGLGFDASDGAITTAIDIDCATTPNTSRTNHGLVMGGRSTDELLVTFVGSVGAENYEPVQLNFNLAGTNPASLSTINVIQMGLYHDTDDMANLRLKCADWWVTVNKNCTDVYCVQNEINFGSGTVAVTGEVAVLGLVLDGGDGTLTNSSWRVINCTLRGSGTPANSAGIFINQESGCGAVDAGIRIEASATMVSAFRIGAPEYNNTPTHLFQFPASGTSPVETGSYDLHGGTAVRISILVGGVQYYMLASTAPGAHT